MLHQKTPRTRKLALDQIPVLFPNRADTKYLKTTRYWTGLLLKFRVGRSKLRCSIVQRQDDECCAHDVKKDYCRVVASWSGLWMVTSLRATIDPLIWWQAAEVSRHKNTAHIAQFFHFLLDVSSLCAFISNQASSSITVFPTSFTVLPFHVLPSFSVSFFLICCP
jgi:hypothetical protein